MNLSLNKYADLLDFFTANPEAVLTVDAVPWQSRMDADTYERSYVASVNLEKINIFQIEKINSALPEYVNIIAQYGRGKFSSGIWESEGTKYPHYNGNIIVPAQTVRGLGRSLHFAFKAEDVKVQSPSTVDYLDILSWKRTQYDIDSSSRMTDPLEIAKQSAKLAIVESTTSIFSQSSSPSRQGVEDVIKVMRDYVDVHVGSAESLKKGSIVSIVDHDGTWRIVDVFKEDRKVGVLSTVKHDIRVFGFDQVAGCVN